MSEVLNIEFEGALFKWKVNGVEYKTFITQTSEKPQVSLIDDDEKVLLTANMGDIPSPYSVPEAKALIQMLKLRAAISPNALILTDGDTTGKAQG